VPISFGSVTTTTLNAGGNNAATVAVNVPASTSDGDMLLLLVSTTESAGVVPTVSGGGWTQKTTIDQVTSGDNQDNRLTLFWRRASSEPASYTVTPDGTYGNYSALAMLRYSGVIRTGDPFRTTGTATGGATAGAGPKTSATLSGVQATDMALHFTGSAFSSWNTQTYDIAGPGGSWVERGEILMNVNSTGHPGHLALEQLGTGTAPTFTATGTGAANVVWCMIGAALMAEPVAVGRPNIVSQAVGRASLR
jgi:hypothetical protein